MLGFARVAVFSGDLNHREIFFDASSFGVPLNPTYGLIGRGNRAPTVGSMESEGISIALAIRSLDLLG